MALIGRTDDPDSIMASEREATAHAGAGHEDPASRTWGDFFYEKASTAAIANAPWMGMGIATAVAAGALVIPVAGISLPVFATGYAPFICATGPMTLSLIENGLTCGGEAGKKHLEAAITTARLLSGISTFGGYFLVNLTHNLEGAQYVLMIGSVLLNTWLNNHAAGKTIANLASLKAYMATLTLSEKIGVSMAVLASGILGAAASTPMMQAVADAANSFNISYEYIKPLNDTLWIVDLLLVSSYMSKGLIGISASINELVKSLQTHWSGHTSITDSIKDHKLFQKSINKLTDLLKNPEQRDRFLRRLATEIKKGRREATSSDELTISDLENIDPKILLKVINDTTEFNSGVCPAWIKQMLAILIAAGSASLYSYITAGELSTVTDEVGILGELGDKMIELFNLVGCGFTVGNTTGSALVANVGNLLLPLVGALDSQKLIANFISDLILKIRDRNKEVETSCLSIGINVVALILGGCSIGTVLAMGAKHRDGLAFAAASSPFLLNTATAPGEISDAMETYGCAEYLLRKVGAAASSGTASLAEKRAAAEAFNTKVEASQKIFNQALTEIQEADAELKAQLEHHQALDARLAELEKLMHTPRAAGFAESARTLRATITAERSKLHPVAEIERQKTKLITRLRATAETQQETMLSAVNDFLVDVGADLLASTPGKSKTSTEADASVAGASRDEEAMGTATPDPRPLLESATGADKADPIVKFRTTTFRTLSGPSTYTPPVGSDAAAMAALVA